MGRKRDRGKGWGGKKGGRDRYGREMGREGGEGRGGRAREGRG